MDPRNFSQNWKLLKESMSDPKVTLSKDEVPDKSIPTTRTKRRKIQKLKAAKTLQKNKPRQNRFVSLDCEFVGTGLDGRGDMLARVSIVDQDGLCILDKYVTPEKKVTDYRTRVSGIRRSDLLAGHSFSDIQSEVQSLLEGKILIGHGIEKDLQVLQLSHPVQDTRDTSTNRALRAMANHTSGKPSLKTLAAKVLGVNIQEGEHDSVTDARITMRLFQLVQHKGSRRTATKMPEPHQK